MYIYIYIYIHIIYTYDKLVPVGRPQAPQAQPDPYKVI